MTLDDAQVLSYFINAVGLSTWDDGERLVAIAEAQRALVSLTAERDALLAVARRSDELIRMATDSLKYVRGLVPKRFDGPYVTVLFIRQGIAGMEAAIGAGEYAVAALAAYDKEHQTVCLMCGGSGEIDADDSFAESAPVGGKTFCDACHGTGSVT